MDQQVVVVTGGGRGIGRAVCACFATDGAQVVAASRSADELEDTRAEIERAGGRCHVRPTDLATAGEIESLIGLAVERFGRVDVLVNCAGVAPLAKIEDLQEDQFERTMAINVNAVYHACRAVWPIMVRQQSGVIVSISSVASVDPFPGFAAYGASKAWVNTWTKALAEEGRDVGIRVFAVAPGAVETKMLRDAFPDFPSDQTLQPADVAEVVHAVCQPACRYATGQVVFARRSGG